MRVLVKLLSAAAGLGLLVTGAAAQNDATGDAGLDTDVSSTFVFNRICYTQLPALQGIRNMSTQLAWEPLDGDKLEAFRTSPDLTLLEAWSVSIGERGFQLAVSEGPISAQLMQTFPDFKNGKATSCTLVLDGTDPSDVFLQELQTLAGKEPASRDVEQNGLFTTTWAGGNADLKVFLIGKVDDQSQGNLINMVLLTK